MLRVLIAEDELMIAELLEDVLIGAGYEVCGIARTVEEAVALGEAHKPDLAVLDFRLAGGGRGTEIARRLNSRGKFGVLYATGDNARSNTLTLADGDAAIAKPYRAEDVARALTIIQEIATTGTATPPFPSGFRLLPESAKRLAQASPYPSVLPRSFRF
jgi:CheY-like chemotaxis protein